MTYHSSASPFSKLLYCVDQYLCLPIASLCCCLTRDVVLRLREACYCHCFAFVSMATTFETPLALCIVMIWHWLQTVYDVTEWSRLVSKMLLRESHTELSFDKILKVECLQLFSSLMILWMDLLIICTVIITSCFQWSWWIVKYLFQLRLISV